MSRLYPCSDGNCILLDRTKLREVHAAGGCEHLKKSGAELQALLREMATEIHQLRSLLTGTARELHEANELRKTLPVVSTCNDCGHCASLYPQGAECWHPKSAGHGPLHMLVDKEASPPLSGCPLRDAP